MICRILDGNAGALVEWGGTDPDVVTLYCTEALWDAEDDVAYCNE